MASHNIGRYLFWIAATMLALAIIGGTGTNQAFAGTQSRGTSNDSFLTTSSKMGLNFAAKRPRTATPTPTRTPTYTPTATPTATGPTATPTPPSCVPNYGI